MMRNKPLRFAAAVVLAVLIVGAFSLDAGSVARSQTRHVVNTTLAWLKSMIVGSEIGEPPALPPQANGTSEQESAPTGRAVLCEARFLKVPPDAQDLWQSLREQGIELIRVSTDPEVYYATLDREQAQAFDASVTLPCFAAPRVIVREGEAASLAVHDRTPQGPRGLALAWLPTISSDGKEVVSTLSFHDGRNGFEIPNVSTEPGGIVLIRARGIFAEAEADDSSPTEVVVRIQVNIQ